MIKLKYLGLAGPNGEKLNEVRGYEDDQAEQLQKHWPNHFILVERITNKKEAPKRSGRRTKKVSLDE